MTYAIDYDQPVPSWTLPVRLEVAFAARWWTDLTDPAVAWTDVTGRLIGVGDGPSVSWTRGRSDVMNRTPQPGSLAVVLDSADGALTPGNTASPYYPNVQPGLPVRWSVFDGTEWAVEFTGFVTNLDPTLAGDLPDWTQINVSAADGWARVMQAGERINLRDRLLRALNMGYPLSAILDPSMGREVWSAGAPESAPALATPPTPQAWGIGWWRLVTATGLLSWASPGAGCILAECGSADQTPYWGDSTVHTGAPTSLFASDRFGGSVTASDGTTGASPLVRNVGWIGTSSSASYTNLSRQQVAAGRPPTQLLPASICDPTGVSGWVASAGTVSRVAASSLTWSAKWDAWDPATGARSTVQAGPTGAYRWTSAVANATLTSPLFPVTVTPGQVVAMQVACSGPVSGSSQAPVGVQFFDAAGSPLGTGFSLAVGSGMNWGSVGSGTSLSGWGVVPAGATQAQVSLRAVASGTIEFSSLGLYTAELLSGTAPTQTYAAPARWHAPGDDVHLNLYVQAPIDAATAASYGWADGSASDLWLFGQATADGIGDGNAHGVAWNLIPGLADPAAASGHRPAVWVDGVEAPVTWHISRSPKRADGTRRTFWTLTAGGNESWRVAEAVGKAAAATLPALAVVAVSPAYAAITGPDAAMMRQVVRWTRQPGVIDATGSSFGTTDVLVAQILDAIAWPESMRALEAGRSSASLSWANTPDDADSANLGDYASAIGDLATGEYGWADVDGSGTFRWLPRGWYDPDGDGITVVSALLTWRSNVPGWTTYMAPLGQAMNEDHACNVVTVSYTGAGVPARYLIDEDSVEHLGVREQALDNAAWSTQDIVDEVAAEVLALSEVTVLPQTVNLVAVGPDDPMVDVILGLSPADTVVVEVPRAPADDLVTTAILEQIALSTDGVTLTATLTLAPCPAPGWALPLYPGGLTYPAPDLYPMEP